MAKKRATKKKAASSKSRHIREYLQHNPDAGPKQIVADLAARGIDVSQSLAVQVKARLRHKRPGRKKRAAGKRMAVPSRSQAALAISADELFEAKKFADRLGGIEQAREALETLERLR
jgi:hypothetical protein